MVWTYDTSAIGTTALPQIRMLIGDTVSTEPLLSDEEINFAYQRRSSVNGAAAMCARSISAKFSRLSDTEVGIQKMALSQKSAQYKALADDLEQLDDSTGGAIPFCGGISISSKQTYEADTDRSLPAVVRNGTDFAIAGGQSWSNIEDVQY